MAKPEVHLPCFSCKEIFIQIPTSPTPETQYAEIQAMLKKKEPKCEKCRIEYLSLNQWVELQEKLDKQEQMIYWKGCRVLIDKDCPPGKIYFVELKTRVP